MSTACVLQLAQFQNERSPTHIHSDENAVVKKVLDIGGSESVSSAATSVDQSKASTAIDTDEWRGLQVLIEAIHQLYIDSNTFLPTPCDWVCENHTQLRCSLLMAVSTIHAQNGLSPTQVINLLLLFAEWHINTPTAASDDHASAATSSSAHENPSRHSSATAATTTAVSEEDATKINRKLTAAAQVSLSKTAIIFDDSHYLASLLLALANVRVDDCNKKDPLDYLVRIGDFALIKLSADVALAKLKATTEREAKDWEHRVERDKSRGIVLSFIYCYIFSSYI